jgi:hypothetical protein
VRLDEIKINSKKSQSLAMIGFQADLWDEMKHAEIMEKRTPLPPNTL